MFFLCYDPSRKRKEKSFNKKTYFHCTYIYFIFTSFFNFKLQEQEQEQKEEVKEVDEQDENL